jgi:uncharacterized protein
MLSENLKEKELHIIDFFKEKKIVVAFSGGVDSSLLAYLSRKYAQETLLVTLKSMLITDEEFEQSKNFARMYSISQLIIEADPLENEEFANNPPNRCYICKKDIFSRFRKIKEDKNFDFIVDGSNVDDLQDYRPGMKALKELGILSPYIELGINKSEIRELSKLYGLNTHSKPSNACLASRIPHNQLISKEKIEMIHNAEIYLHNTFNIDQLRVRFHENRLARIEIPKNQLEKVLKPDAMEEISANLKRFGFLFVTIDLEGFRSGSLSKMTK